MLNHILTDMRTNIGKRRAMRLTGTSRYRDKLAELPPGLFDYWAATASKEFQGIPRDALFYARAAEALMAFFECVAFSGKPCALPSKAADSVWHAWLLHAPASLQDFCVKHYDRVIPHLESDDMAAPMDEALANSLVASRKLAGLLAGGANLPPLFRTDRDLAMPHGHLYRIVRGKVALAAMDGRGRQQGDLTFPASLAASALLSGGLVHGWEVPLGRREDGGSCGAALMLGGGDSGDSGCDGSGDGGGSGCGGGCGGGS